MLVLRDGNLEKNLTVDSKTTSVNIQDLAVLTEYCVRIRLIAEEANGNLSDCFNFTTKEFHGKFRYFINKGEVDKEDWTTEIILQLSVDNYARPQVFHLRWLTTVLRG